ncbi:TonB family protein [Brucellaceae bacterium VT-16-1752]|nr:TonB family protein [Brucellaceae bacterium VT-16-1752]
MTTNAKTMTVPERAEQRWLGRLSAHLERRKRYPTSAQSRKLEGIVQVRFGVDLEGTIMAPELVRSSGVPELDEEVSISCAAPPRSQTAFRRHPIRRRNRSSAANS